MTSKADEKRSNAYTRASVRKKVEEYAGGDSIEYDLTEEGGKKIDPFFFPHPFFYDSETKKAIREADDDDDEAQGRILLGDAEFDRFIAEGGTPDEIGLFMIAVSRDIQNRPTKG